MISERNRRRLAMRTMKRQQHAIRSGTTPSLAPRPDQDEVFCLYDDGSGKPMYFDIRAMRLWAQENMEPLSLGVEHWRAMRMLETGQVEMDHVMAVTVRQKPDPIIVCKDAAGEGEDAIVDGAHRYVAAALGAAMISTKQVGYHAYILDRDQWMPFIVGPDRLAELAATNG